MDLGGELAVARNRKSEPIGSVIRRARASQHTRPQRRETGQPIRVAIADDSYLVRNALGEVLGQIGSVELVATAEDGDGLLESVDTMSPDVVIIDIRMPPSGDDEGIRVATELREDHPEVGVIVLSQFSDPRYALALLEGGAEGRGYLLKERVHDREELASAIDIVASGGTMIDPTVIEGLIDTFKLLEEQGLAILLIEQNLGVATALADRQLVMIGGSIAAETTATKLATDPDLQRRYLGVEPLAH